jgi:hypothetical protein
MNSIEPLEARIAPATLTGRVLTYTDTDGDNVTVTFSKGTLTATNFTFDNAFATAGGQQLQLIDLGGSKSFQGVNLTVSVVQNGGDGLVNLGTLNASGVDLGKVTIAGDLSRIVAGDANVKTAAVKSLSVNTFGAAGTATQGTGANMESDIIGKLGALNVTGDFSNMFLYVSGGMSAKNAKFAGIGSVTIGGDLVGGSADGSGYIDCTGSLGKLQITGDLTGGSGEGSGKVRCDGNLGTTTVGSITGGQGIDSGKIRVYGTAQKITVNGDITGGDVILLASDGAEAGIIEVTKSVKSIVISGNIVGINSYYSGLELHASVGSISVQSILGGAADYDGSIIVEGNLGKLTVTGGLSGGGGVYSGSVEVQGNLGKVSVAAYALGGEGTYSGSFYSGGKIGTFTMSGALLGGTGVNSGAVEGFKGIASITVGGISGDDGFGSGQIHCDSGSLQFAHITGSIAGGDGSSSSGALYSDGKIGTVIIDGSLSGGDAIQSGSIYANSGLTKVTIGGSIESGSGSSSGSVDTNGKLGSLSVGVDISGTASDPVKIAAVKGIGNVTVTGNVEQAQLLAGYSIFGENQNASIGTVKIGGNLTATSIVAGMSSGLDGLFGTADDTAIDFGSGAQVSTIAKIIIGGTADGTAASGDHFGIEAQWVKSISIGGSKLALKNGKHNDFVAIGTNGDFNLTEAGDVA